MIQRLILQQRQVSINVRALKVRNALYFSKSRLSQIQKRKKPTHKQDVYMNRKVFKTVLN